MYLSHYHEFVSGCASESRAVITLCSDGTICSLWRAAATLCPFFLKRHKTSKCLLGAPQATVPVLIMESECSVTTQSEAVANYVVITRRRTHLVTGLAQGRDAVSARVFWMSALPARSSQQAEGCAWFCFFFCFVFLCVTEDSCLSSGGRGRKRSTLDKTQGEM